MISTTPEERARYPLMPLMPPYRKTILFGRIEEKLKDEILCASLYPPDTHTMGLSNTHQAACTNWRHSKLIRTRTACCADFMMVLRSKGGDAKQFEVSTSQVLTPLYTSLTMLPDPLPHISVCLMQLQCTVLHVPYAHQSYMFVIPLNKMTRLS